MLEQLKAQVFCGILELFHHGLTTQNYGSLSGIHRESGYLVIKPAGIHYRDLQLADLLVVDLDGTIIEGTETPSVDLSAHLQLYRGFPKISCVCHIKSRWATVFAQMGKGILPYSSLHSNHFQGEIPCTRRLTLEEIREDFQNAVGQSMVQLFSQRDPLKTPGALVQNHGAYTWGVDIPHTVRCAQVLEESAMTAWHSLAVSNGILRPIPLELQDWYHGQPRD